MLRQAELLARLSVAVVIPCFNEDPEILSRVLSRRSTAGQSRRASSRSLTVGLSRSRAWRWPTTCGPTCSPGLSPHGRWPSSCSRCRRSRWPPGTWSSTRGRSLYRGWLIHQVLPAYLGEKFFGTPVTLGDDTGLTMFALAYGRAVHQPTAVSMPAYPEKLSHHLRQWTRWMRASTIRTLWRMRYLRLRSYAFWFVLYQQYAFYASVAVSVAVPMAWPASRNIVIDSAIALVAWPLAVATRMLTISRPDIRWPAWLGSVALLPAAALWYLLVLRQIRFYGMATCYIQSWVTRQQGAEVKSHDTAPPPAIRAGAA
jgi:hypothetical protein